MIRSLKATGVYCVSGVVCGAEQGSRQSVASCALQTALLERERGGKKAGGKKKKRPKAVPSELSEDPRLPV